MGERLFLCVILNQGCRSEKTRIFFPSPFRHPERSLTESKDLNAGDFLESNSEKDPGFFGVAALASE